jgi:hypothetical protein
MPLAIPFVHSHLFLAQWKGETTFCLIGIWRHHLGCRAKPAPTYSTIFFVMVNCQIYRSNFSPHLTCLILLLGSFLIVYLWLDILLPLLVPLYTLLYLLSCFFHFCHQLLFLFVFLSPVIWSLLPLLTCAYIICTTSPPTLPFPLLPDRIYFALFLDFVEEKT